MAENQAEEASEDIRRGCFGVLVNFIGFLVGVGGYIAFVSWIL